MRLQGRSLRALRARSMRALRPAPENLEQRLVLTMSSLLSNAFSSSALAKVLVQPTYQLHPVTNLELAALSGTRIEPSDQWYGSSSPCGFDPAQIRTAYGIDSIAVGTVTGSGAGQTIAIVDAYDDPDLVNSSASGFSSSDLARFDQQYGLQDPPSFVKLNEYGGTSLPGTDPAGAGDPLGNWELEEAIDVEWAHAVAPAASIVLIECNSDSGADLYQGAATAALLPGVSVVSMSWGSSEYSGEQSYDGTFTTPAAHQGVTFVACTGDNGSPGYYPAYSPNVVAVGGTSLYLNANNTYNSETAWSGSGGGVSAYESEPAYQLAVQSTGKRTIPDVAFNADPDTGMAVYDSYDGTSSQPWVEVGGTSLAAPAWAGLIAIVDQARVATGSATLDGPSQTLAALYSLPGGDFHAIPSGTNGGFSTAAGYDDVTGRGTPQANLLVPDLAKFGAPAGQLVIVAQPPASVAAGSGFGLTAWVENFQGQLETNFNGTVAITLASSPTGASLGGTLDVSAQGGMATFSGLVLTRAGAAYTLALSAAAMRSATSNVFTVTAAAPTHLVVVSQPPRGPRAGSPFRLSVAAEDTYGNVATSFSGPINVSFSSNPGRALLSGTLSVVPNQGVAVFANLTVNRMGGGYTMLATATGLLPARTIPFNVLPDAPSRSRALARLVRLVQAAKSHGPNAARPSHRDMPADRAT